MARYTALIDGKAGAYGVVFADLPGCTAMGKSIDDALNNARNALHDWISVMKESGNKIPQPRSLEMLRGDCEVETALTLEVFDALE